MPNPYDYTTEDTFDIAGAQLAKQQAAFKKLQTQAQYGGQAPDNGQASALHKMLNGMMGSPAQAQQPATSYLDPNGVRNITVPPSMQ